MKTKKQHLRALRDIQRSIARQIDRVSKEAHIPIWFLRLWGSDIKDAANFMQKEIKKAKKRRNSND